MPVSARCTHCTVSGGTMRDGGRLRSISQQSEAGRESKKKRRPLGIMALEPRVMYDGAAVATTAAAATTATAAADHPASAPTSAPADVSAAEHPVTPGATPDSATAAAPAPTTSAPAPDGSK